jgi:putative hydrolase of the HAD superfamily
VSGQERPVRVVLLDLGYTLVRWEVAEDVRLAGCDEWLGRLAAAQRGSVPAAELVLSLERHVLAAARASYERDRHTEVDNHALFAAALAEHGYVLSETQVRELVDLEHAAFARHLAVSPGTVAALEALRARGLRLGLVSNALTPGALMRRTLDALELAGYVDAVVFSSEIGVRKPHPRIYEAVLEELGADPQEAVFVGDRVREDVAGPQAVGMWTILTHEFRQEVPDGVRPDAVVQAFAEVPDAIAKL